jgi:hypothetical protein
MFIHLFTDVPDYMYIWGKWGAMGHVDQNIQTFYYPQQITGTCVESKICSLCT